MGHHMTPVIRTSVGVLLVHAGVVGLMAHQWVSADLSPKVDQVILASIVMTFPVQTPAPPKPTSKPETRTTRSQTPSQAAQAITTPEDIKTTSSDSVPSEGISSIAPTIPVAHATPATSNAHLVTTVALPTVPPSSDADYLNNPAPSYPRMSRRMGEQGTVVVKVFINAEGRAEKAVIRTSSGYSRLDESALETVKRWRFVPGKRAGQAEAMWFNVPIRFLLD